MPIYRCLIRGENFPGQLIGKKSLVGFYTTRFIEAVNAIEAESAGLDLLKADPDLQIRSEKLQRQKPPAKVYFEEVVEMDDDVDQSPNRGATWFEMK